MLFGLDFAKNINLQLLLISPQPITFVQKYCYYETLYTPKFLRHQPAVLHHI